jgi:hypothetical protein
MRTIPGFAAFLLSITVTVVSAQTVVVCEPAADSALQVVGKLLTAAVQAKYKGTVSFAKPACGEKECALKIAGENKAQEVIFSSIIRLGNKFIFNGAITNFDGSNLYTQKLTTEKIEDFEQLCDRMAEALVNRKTVELATSIENVSENEAEKDARKGRRTHYASGVTAGFAYPVGHSFQYVERKIRYAYPTSETLEFLKRNPQLFKLGWANFWEFKNNLALDAQVLGFLPVGFGADIDVVRFLNHSDFSPFLGGGIGIHWVRGDDTVSETSTKRNFGPAFNVQGGIMMFRTYNIHVLARAQYHFIANSDIDNCLSGDIVLLLDKKDTDHNRYSGDSSWKSYILYLLLGSVVLSIIGSATKN